MKTVKHTLLKQNVMPQTSAWSRTFAGNSIPGCSGSFVVDEIIPRI